MDSTFEQLSVHPFLQHLTPEDIGLLADLATPALFPANLRIFDEGDEADRFWLIREGRVRLDTIVPGRGPVIVETIGSGAVLGWSWLYPPQQWHFGARTMAETSALELDGPGVLELCRQRPALGYTLMTGFLPVVIDRLQNTRLRLLDLYGEPA